MSENETSITEIVSASYTLEFTILTVLEDPSILISLGIFAHFVSRPAARKKRHQHSVFVLLLVNFIMISTDIPMSLGYYHAGGVVRAGTHAYCTWWTFYDYSLFTVSAAIMAWISIERHLLIFHEGLLGGVGSWKQWSLHVAPWLVCPTWGPLLYLFTNVSGLVFAQTWYFDTFFCGSPCFMPTVGGALEVFINVLIPVLIISIADLALIILMIYRRKNLVSRRRINWRSQL